MKISLKFWVAIFSLLFAGWGTSVVQGETSSDRPFYEYKGNYDEEATTLKKKFFKKFGYKLVDLERRWALEEIKVLHEAFDQLPESLHHLPGLKGLYRLERIVLNSANEILGDVPAATLPSFSTIYENSSQSYKVFIEDQDLRVEFYNALFYEDRADLINIVHHEMAHAFDFVNKFPSFSDEWLSLTKFRVLHIFALDGTRDSDFLYALVNDPKVSNYAPVSTRHLPTYSRQNPQEDFANSVAAYIHYPYFRYTHSLRYQFLKEHVFGGREYFPEGSGSETFEEWIFSSLENERRAAAWDEIRAILVEVSRGYYPELEGKIVQWLREALGTVSVSSDKDRVLAQASCFLSHPDSLNLRRDLIRTQRMTVQDFFKDPRCLRMARDTFEKDLSTWSPANLYFIRENGDDMVQFVDPILVTAHARGFDTDYFWRIYVEGGGGKPFTEGRKAVEEGGNGSVQVDLQETAFKPFTLPEGSILRLELGARRTHPRTFKTLESQMATIRFVVQPWSHFWGPHSPGIQVVRPLRSSGEFH